MANAESFLRHIRVLNPYLSVWLFKEVCTFRFRMICRLISFEIGEQLKCKQYLTIQKRRKHSGTVTDSAQLCPSTRPIMSTARPSDSFAEVCFFS